MKYLLDTDTLIYWLKGDIGIERKALSVGLNQLSYSIISQAELYFGAYNSQHIEQNLSSIQLISSKLKILNFDDKSAGIFGRIKASLKQKGNIILDADIMISAIAIANNSVLVTNNIKHFERIPDLKIENWIAA